MTESSEIKLPPVIKTSENEEIQRRVDEKLTRMEETNPSSNLQKTNLELISANNNQAFQLVLETQALI